jgi:hypothetical protein
MLQFVDYSSLIHLRNSGCGHKIAVQAIFFSPPPSPSPSLSLSVSVSLASLVWNSE